MTFFSQTLKHKVRKYVTFSDVQLYDWKKILPWTLRKNTAAAAKSLQLCPTLCDPMTAAHQAPRPWDSPDKNIGVGCHFLLQCVKVKSLNRAQLLATPWTAAYQAPPSMGFSRQEYWSGRRNTICKKKKKVLSLDCTHAGQAACYWNGVLCLVTQLCLTLFKPRNCSPPGSWVHGILQVRILEWVAMPSSKGSSQLRNWTQVSHIAGRFFNIWATREAQEYWSG